MSKMKTKKSASKRFKITPSGRIKCSAAGRRHLLTKKTTKNKRHLRGPSSVHCSDAALVRAMMPYA